MPKTIDDIIPPSRRRQMGMDPQNPHTPTAPLYTPPANDYPPVPPTPPSTTPLSDLPPMPPTPPPRVHIRTGRSFPYGTALLALVIILVCAGALYAFSGAKVVITPTTQNVALSDQFTATLGSGSLPFNIITVNKTASVSVPAESTETANDSAQGTIIVSNAQTTAQTLINNTRFETPNGIVFRVHTPITIPAATSNGPGTLTVTVYADQPGQASNVGPTTFTVPGLQGSSSYALVTAKSTSPISGGFTGTRASVSQSTDTTEDNALQQTLATTLQTQLAANVPSGDVLIPGGASTSYQTQPDTATTSSSVQVTEQGTETAVVFPETALAQAIAYKKAGSYSGEPVTLDGVSKLEFSAPTGTSSTTDSTDITSATTLTFTLTGNTTIIWKVDTSKIAGAVAGKTRDSAQNILSGFSEVDKAVLTLRPFWASTFPQDPSHINVTVVNPTTDSQ